MLKEVKICGEVYKVIYTKSYDTVNTHGSMRWADGIIYINAKLSKEKQKLVLLHEVLHCIGEITSFGNMPSDISELDAEEGIIRRLEHVLYQVLKDNEGLLIGSD